MTTKGQNIQLFLADGTANGVRIAEIKFRSERVTAASRTDLAKQRDLEETQRTGIYLLLGSADNSPLDQRVYIGESDDVSARLEQHSKRAAKEPNHLEWWEQTVTITSNDANLTKAHALYLESALISRARSAARAEVANIQESDRSTSLSRADRSDMEVFLANVFVILPLLSVDLFRPQTAVRASEAATVSASESPIFELTIHGKLLATGQEVDGVFVVAANSKARPWMGTVAPYKALHEKLVTTGILRATSDGGDLLFTRGVEFTSPSAAAAVVSGRNANGRTAWVRQDGRGTYATWQDQVTGATP